MQKNLYEGLYAILPTLGKGRSKGQNGIIGVIGGSSDYTGAPFYTGISVLKGGADLSHVYCSKDAALSIKSYSPELIVHGTILEDERISESIDKQKQLDQSLEMTTKWFYAPNSFAIGPGLGRYNAMEHYFIKYLDAIGNNKPIIYDGDALWYISKSKIKEKVISALSKRGQLNILTPNKVEFSHLWEICCINNEKSVTEEEYNIELKGILDDTTTAPYLEINIDSAVVRDTSKIARVLGNSWIIRKGEVDVITNGEYAYIVKEEGTLKRTGGQGDVLAGLLSLYSFWALSKNTNLGLGCIVACIVVRKAAKYAFQLTGMGMTTPNVIEQLPKALHEVFPLEKFLAQ